jgi:hypothetical protein
MRAQSSSFFFAALSLTSSLVFSQNTPAKERGQWVKGNFAQVNIGCLQAYQCVPGIDLLHGNDTVVKTTPSEGVMGVCNAGGGAADGCNFCASSPPPKPCEYWLEKSR